MILHFPITEESVDEGVYSFDSGTSRLSTPDVLVVNSPPSNLDVVAEDKTAAPDETRKPRRDSVMEQTLTQMVIKNWENSQGLAGFRHKLANEISHKYCSYCRCDDIIFVFLYVLFGIMYICAGAQGLVQCSSELYVNLFLIIDGVLSVFVFPITIMEWTKRIGGCVQKEDKQGHRLTFIVIVILRIAAAVIGSVVVVMRVNVFPWDDPVCWTVFTLLEFGVVLEWMFLVLVMLLPILLYICAYMAAGRL